MKKKIWLFIPAAILIVMNIFIFASLKGNDDSGTDITAAPAVPMVSVTDVVSNTEPMQEHGMTQTEDEISWLGWQKAAVGSEAVQLYADQAFTQTTDITIQPGEELIICGRVNDACKIRYGTAIGWTSIERLAPMDEPVIYQTTGVSDPVSIKGSEVAGRLDDLAESYRCIGVQMAIISDGQVTGLYEYGLANRGEDIAMTADTKLRIASVSKVVTAMGVLAMHDMGTLNIDSNISEYWDETIRNPYYHDHPITLRHILTHTSSMKDFGYKNRSTSVLKSKLRTDSSYYKIIPGEAAAHDYNNSAVCAAGAIAGNAAGCNFDKYMREYFFAPMGIDASFHAGNLRQTELIAPTYNEGTTTMTVNDMLNVTYNGGPADDYTLYSGGLMISAQDMARMVCILMNGGQYDGQYYLKSDTIQQMLTTHYQLEDYDQCLILRHKDGLLGERSMYYHNGNMLGVYSLVCFDAENGDGMVIITNGARDVKLSGGVYNVCRELAEAASVLWTQ